jgi:hypothetical protein
MEKTMKKTLAWLTVLTSLLSMMSIAAAQEPSVGSPAQDPRWGTVNPQQLNVAAVGFTPLEDGQWTNTPSGWSNRTGGTNTTTCANVHLPGGALLHHITTWTNDTDAANDVSYSLFSVDLTTNTVTTPFTFSTTGTPGIERAARALSPAITISNDRRTYSICVFQTGTTAATQYAGATFWYHLQVSPSPASASFTDVPTDSWAFQWIEALKASGITSGCTATTFCPNNNVSRAEMAVFLSRALGL